MPYPIENSLGGCCVRGGCPRRTIGHLSALTSFTLSSGVFADEAGIGVTAGAAIRDGLRSFVLSAAIELKRNLRIDVVSPTMVADCAEDFGHLFRSMKPGAMDELVGACVFSIEGKSVGEIFRMYGR